MAGINYNSECPVCGHKMLNHKFKEMGIEGHSIVEQKENTVVLSKDMEIYVTKVIKCGVSGCEQSKDVGYCFAEGL